ncbi:uncharacterized protein LOC126908498 isoform X2 [Daktulosphaira vitifoliae]|uniref:uncharacterized protein LOC126908498 isoform X2 n=1 Tax=Daktulosphaira vitifoliae TaxID=58002 RepID=UPI0021A9CEF5|nr:uncharacterized protein LOC126908498 isoform X2 [Daktulosphaira vitifoliae]
MLLHFFILNFFFFSVISCQSNINPLNFNVFRNNLIDLVDHFRLQDEWKYLQHIQLRMDKQIVNVNQIFFSDINEFNVIPKFKQITLVFNYRYYEILKSFNDAIKMFVIICEDKQSNISIDEYVDCVKQLKKNLVDSIDMYERLYKAICFISNIYFYLTKDIPIILQPQIVGDALLQIKQFINFKSKSNLATNENMDTVLKEFISIKLFFEKTTKLLLENFIKKNDSFYYNKSTVNIFDYYELQLPINCLDGKSDYVRDMGNILKDFYHYTIKKYYDDFDFNKIIHLEILGQYRPNEINSQPKDVPALDIIIKQSGWNVLHYIRILTNNNKLLHINDIITGHVNPSNFSTKAFNLNKLLKCRYTEILHHYTVLINNIISQCNDKNKDNYKKNFVHCVLQLYHSVDESQNMLDNMLSALKRWQW